MRDRSAKAFSILVVGLLVLAPGRGHAQGWAWVDGFGYGAAAGGVAVLAVPEDDDLILPVLLVATVGGAYVGARVGGAADDRLAAGEGLTGGHRAAVVVGSVLAGGGVGATVAAVWLGASGAGTSLGSDTETFAAVTAAGAAAGGLVTWWKRDALRPRSVHVAPALSTDGGVGVRVRVGF